MPIARPLGYLTFLAGLTVACGSEDYRLPSYDAQVPTGTGNWQPAPRGAGQPQAQEDATLVPSVGAVHWETSLSAARDRAAAEGKPIFLVMTRPQCPNTALWSESLLTGPEMTTLLEERLVPLALGLDVLNTEAIAARGGKPTLSGQELEDNDQRLTLKNALYDLSPRDPRQPPFVAVLDETGEVLATDTGLLTASDTLSLLKRGGLDSLPSALTSPSTPPARSPAGRVLNAYQLDPMQDMDWTWATGNGAAGEAADGAGMSSLSDPFVASGKEHGLAGFGLIFGGTGRTQVGQIVLSGGGTGNSTMNFTNPPLLVDWSNSGEGIQYYNPVIGPDVEDVEYANGGNFVSVLSSTSTDTLSILGCPPAHRHYNGTVRVGRHPMGVALGYTQKTAWAFAASPLDGTLAAVFLDIPNGEQMGDRTGEVVYFDAATGEALETRKDGQLIDSEGRGGGQQGFHEIPGEPGPRSEAGVLLGPEDLALIQGNNWDKDHVAWLAVSNAASDTVSIFDAAPFLRGKHPNLLLVGTFTGIEHPRKLHWIGNQYLWVGSNPGNTVTRLSIDKLPTLDNSTNETYTVGKNPVYMREVAAWWNQSFLVVANSGDDSVTLLKEDGTLVGTLDASNGPPLSEPYGVWASYDGLRFMVSNRSGDYAAWWNVRRRLEGWKFEGLEDVIVSSGLVHTGPGVTALDGDYIP